MIPSMKDNYLFLKEVKNLVEKTNCELKVCFQYMNRGDRWIQVRGSGPGGARCEHPGTQLPTCVWVIPLSAQEHRDLREQVWLLAAGHTEIICMYPQGLVPGSRGVLGDGYKEKGQSMTKTQKMLEPIL